MGNLEDNISLIAAKLKEIQEASTRQNHVVFVIDQDRNYYAQFGCDGGDSLEYAELVSNAFLAPPFMLKRGQVDHLLKQGWDLGDKNFHRMWPAGDDHDRKEIARVVMSAFLEVYGVALDARLTSEVILGRESSPAASTMGDAPHAASADGNTVGTAREELTALLGESLFRTRKNFGMFGQIQISIRDVTPEWLLVGIFTRHALDGASVALNVRNAVLNWLQDLLPVDRFIAVYENPTLGITSEVHDLPYAEELPNAGQLRSAEILVEEIAGPARDQLRGRFRVAWQRFEEEEAR